MDELPFDAKRKRLSTLHRTPKGLVLYSKGRSGSSDNFASIVWAIEEGRTVFANIRKFLTYVPASKVAELVPFVAFVVFKILLALTIIQVLAIHLGCALISRAYLFLGFLEGGVGMATFFYVLHQGSAGRFSPSGLVYDAETASSIIGGTDKVFGR